MEHKNIVCPNCKGNNDCTVNSKPYECWCMTIEIDHDVRNRLPKSKQCLCQKCLQKLIALNESL